MNLLIVESPIAARRIVTLLPDGWRVEATRGHLRDLPVDALAIDLKHDFALQYQIVPDHFGTLNRLKEAARNANVIYLGTAPDREGETIAAHLAELLRDELKGKPQHRVTFSAVTKAALMCALENPRPIDARLVEAQSARRTLDRLVGYLLSPLASQVLKAPHSIGRVQMAALWLLAAREVNIKTFKAQLYWTLEATFKPQGGTALAAHLTAVQARHSDEWSSQTVQNLATALQNGGVFVHEVLVQTELRQPPPPFTTSALLQAACETLHLSPDRVMLLAHALYEQGLITHPRTDSTYVPSEAQESARMYIREQFGVPYVPLLPQVFTGHQAEAHEAIRPTDPGRTPEELSLGDSAALYTLIWRRFLASQMADAQIDVQTVTLQAGKKDGERLDVYLSARAEQCTFDGFHKLRGETLEADPDLSALSIGQMLHAEIVTPTEHVPHPPQPYTDSTLIATLEAYGVGRPATYASTLKLLTDKGYLIHDGDMLTLTAHARSLCAFLARHFPEPFIADFTASLERQLDQIASGETTRLAVLREFWNTFTRTYRPLAAVFMPETPRQQTAAPLGICPKCGSKLVMRHTKHGGQFAGCERFPKCDGRAAPVVLSAVRAGR